MSPPAAILPQRLSRSAWTFTLAALLICGGLVGMIAALSPPPRWPSLMARGLGHLTFWSLAAVLLSSPLARLRPRSRIARLVRWRRQLGLALLVPAVLHFGFVVWSTPDLLRLELHPTTDLPGFLSLACLITLGVTSPARVQRALGAKRWKRLHRRLIVVAFIATVPAALAAEFAPLGLAAAPLAILVLSYRWRYYRGLEPKARPQSPGPGESDPSLRGDSSP